MEKRIEWQTPKGTQVTLSLLTSQETDADGDKITVPCYSLECWAGHTLLSNPIIAEHPQAGTCIRGGMRSYVPIPADKLAEVKAMVAAYWAEIDRRRASARAEDANYREMTKDVCPLCGTYCDGDCQAH